MAWNKVKVGDLGRIVTGKTPKTIDRDNYNGPIMFVTPSDNMESKYIYSTGKTITEKGKLSVKGAIVPAGAVCVSCIGSDLGKVVITTEECVTNQQINSIIVDVDKYDIDFIYYAMMILGKELNFHSKTSTAVPIVNKSSFSSYEISCPTIGEQRKIASVLSALDDKIDNNAQINENLSDQIQAIYNSEFNPTTHTPSGILADICHYSSDRIAVSELSVSTYYSTENMQPNKMGSVDATSLPSIAQTTGCHKGDVLISNIRPYFKKIVYVTDDGYGCSTDVLCFVPKDDQYSAFLFGTLYRDRFFDYMVAGSKGTKMPRGDKQQIMNFPVVLPDKESLNRFNGLVVPMLDQIAFNRIESSRLTALRDALLPRLMSGELDVSNLKL